MAVSNISSGIAPSKETIISGEYPFYRPLYIVTKGEPKGEVRQFVEFALGPKGQKVISRMGTVNLEEGKNLKVN